MNRSRWRSALPRTAVLVALAVAVLGVSSEAPAQEEPKPSPSPSPATETESKRERRGTLPGDEQKVFVIQHVPPGRLATLLEVFPAHITWIGALGSSRDPVAAIAVSAKPAVLAAIGATIKRLDLPDSGAERSGPNVELTGYVLEATSEATESAPLPAELSVVVAQLKETLRYPGYRLLDLVVARGREGSVIHVAGIAEDGASTRRRAEAFYTLHANRVRVGSGPAPRMVELAGFRFELELPIPLDPPRPDPDKPASFSYRKIGMQADLGIREGQHVVVGKSGLARSDNAIVLVLSAKIVE